MSRYEYTPTKVNLTDHHKDKIRKAIEAGKTATIQLKYDDLTGDDVLALTKGQIANMVKAFEAKQSVRITMSKTQLEHNKTVEGGFLGALLTGVASAVLPSAISWIYNKIKGQGLYLKSGTNVANIKQLGEGLYIKSYTGSKLNMHGNGLFLRKGDGFEQTDGNLKDLEPLIKLLNLK